MPPRHNLRSIRLDFGPNRLIMERNGTSSQDTLPFCAKSKSQTFLAKLCDAAGVDQADIFRGSANHMVFITEAQGQKMLGASLADIEQFGTKDDSTRHDHQITVDPADGILSAGGGAPSDDDLDSEDSDEGAREGEDGVAGISPGEAAVRASLLSTKGAALDDVDDDLDDDYTDGMPF